MRAPQWFLFIGMLGMAASAHGEETATVRPPGSSEFVATHYSRPLETLIKGINVQVVWAGSIKQKTIALTFDDGPHPRYTPQILKILEEHRIPATFFVIGQNAQRNPEVLKQIQGGGHQIGNHTYSHVKLPNVASQAIKEELEKTREIIQAATGQTTHLFRPPFGAFDARSLAELAIRRFDAVLWSVDSRDWTRPGVEEIRRNILSSVQGGSIILCHDDNEQIAEALPGILRTLKQRGYRFVTIPELVSPSAWGG